MFSRTPILARTSASQHKDGGERNKALAARSHHHQPAERESATHIISWLSPQQHLANRTQIHSLDSPGPPSVVIIKSNRRLLLDSIKVEISYCLRHQARWILKLIIDEMLDVASPLSRQVS
jgi:hypothetical protein